MHRMLLPYGFILVRQYNKVTGFLSFSFVVFTIRSFTMYISAQAPTLEVKEFWVKEIKKVLMGQFDEIKSR